MIVYVCSDIRFNNSYARRSVLFGVGADGVRFPTQVAPRVVACFPIASTAWSTVISARQHLLLRRSLVYFLHADRAIDLP